MTAARKVEQFFARYQERTFPKGQVLIHAGDDIGMIFYLASGKVRQYDISYRGDNIIVNIYKPGAFFPMLPALTGLPNKYFFEAETGIKVRPVPYGEVLKFLDANPDVAMDLLKRIYIGMDGLLGRMVQLMAGSALDRLVYELLVEARRFDEKTAGDVITIRLTQADLAARAGLSRETVSREIQKIKQLGLIKPGRSGLEIKSLEQLSRLIEE